MTKILAITQARSGSTRLPNKVLKKIGVKTLLQIHLERILLSKQINQLLVATTIAIEDAAIAEIASEMNLKVYRGSVSNVLDRFYQAAKPIEPEWIIRLTADCPLIDPALIDEIIEAALKKNVDYCSNTLKPTFPDGMDIEVFKFSALERAWKEAELESDKEHVTPFIWRNSSFHNGNKFSAFNFSNNTNYEQVRLTVDESQDLEVIANLIEKLGTDKGWKTYAEYYLAHPALKEINKHISRNEGYKKN